MKSKGFKKSEYNQEGNYAYLDTQVNKAIGKKPPKEYFGLAKKQCETKVIEIGSITDYDRLLKSMKTNCVPETVFDMEEKDYHSFLDQRRKLMAKKIRKYYEML